MMITSTVKTSTGSTVNVFEDGSLLIQRDDPSRDSAAISVEEREAIAEVTPVRADEKQRTDGFQG